MIKASLIKVDGEVQEITPKNGTDFKLEELQQYVGGYVQIIDIGCNQIMCMDEEGKLKNKDVNLLATFYATGHIFGNDMIVGDVIVCLSMMVK